MKKPTPLLLALLLAGCAATPPAPQALRAPDVDPLAATLAQRDIELLMTYLEGSWETIPQQAGYGDSRLMRLRIARLWPERTGQYWLYTEYVDGADDRRAIRQRIMRFQRIDSKLVSDLYRVPGDPAAALGEWRKEKPFAALNPATLAPMPGCRASWLKQMESLFAGGTEGKTCRGDRPETVDEHSDFYLASSSIRTWVRGMDASGKVVEGPTGPSEFRKVALKPR